MRRGDRRVWLLTGAIALLFAVGGAYWIGAGGNDDTHITYWAADALGRGSIVNYNGEAVEQSSSLTVVVVLGLLGKLLPVSTPDLGWVMSLLFGALAIVQAHRLANRLVPGSGPAAAALTASSWCLFYWSTSGMETAMAAAAAPTLIMALERATRQPSDRNLGWLALVALAFAALRPENGHVLGCVLVVLLAQRWRAARAETLAAGTFRPVVVALIVLLGLIALRRLAFGLPLPHPALAKIGGFDAAAGLRYLRDSLLETNPLLIATTVIGLLVAARSLWRARSEDLQLQLTAAMALAQLSFVIMSGGDWMLHGRLLVPAIAVLAALAAPAVWSLARRQRHAASAALVLMAAGGAMTIAVRLDRDSKQHIPIRLARRIEVELRDRLGEYPFSLAEVANPSHLRDMPLIVHMLRVLAKIQPTEQEPLVMVSGQAGMVPYHIMRRYAGKVKLIDMYSLTSSQVARCLPEAVASRSRYGIRLRLDRIIDPESALGPMCGLPRPTLLFGPNLNGKAHRMLQANGYTLAYLQQGSPLGEKGPKMGGYIAVDRQVAVRLGLKRFDWYWTPLRLP